MRIPSSPLLSSPLNPLPSTAKPGGKRTRERGRGEVVGCAERSRRSRRMVGLGRASRQRDERIPSYGMRAQRFKGLPACPLFKCMLNARSDVRDSLINPLTSHPLLEPSTATHGAALCSVRVFYGGTPQYRYATALHITGTIDIPRRWNTSHRGITWTPR